MRLGIHWPRLLAEGAVICASVILALAADAWWDGRQEEASEASYLALLRRDLERIRDDLGEQIAFEKAQVRDGVEAYRGLSAPPASLSASEQIRISERLQHLMVRRTLVPEDATYRDLIGSGNLSLIDDPMLRNQIVDFFEGLRGRAEIVDRNNAVFVDDQYAGTLARGGLILPRATGGNLPDRFIPVESQLAREWEGGYTDEGDRLWRLPRDGPEWASLQSILLTRIRISSYGAMQVEGLLQQTEELLAALEAER